MKIIKEAISRIKNITDAIHSLHPGATTVKPAQQSLEDAIQAFKLDPYSCFYISSILVDWGIFLEPIGLGSNLTAPYVSIESCGIKLGYITRFTAVKGGLQLEIGHFAVVHECVGTGVATAMAQALRTKMREHYNTEMIIFNEEHSRFHDCNYKTFFENLGAINPDPNLPRRWEWDIS